MVSRVHGILQARTLEWVAFPFSRGSSPPRDRTQASRIAGGFFTGWAPGKPSQVIRSRVPELRSRSLLVLYFVLSSVCMSVPNKTLLSRPRFSHLQHGDNKSLPDLYSLPLMILFRLQLDDTVELLSVVSISPNPWSLASLYAEHCKAAIPPAAQKIKEIKRT